MALRALRASSTNLTRHSILSPRYLSNDIGATTADADGPPTSAAFSRKNNNTSSGRTNARTSRINIDNPLRLNLSQHTATVQNYHINVCCTPNNTHIVMCDSSGHPVKSGSWSGGSCGFKGVNRSGYEAGYQCAVRAFARAKQLARESAEMGGGGASAVGGGVVRFEVLFKGFGRGREAVYKALMTSEGDDVRPFITRVTDNTPIKIGGTRAKKTRRL
jgi:small subunit ribosomal protein S11